MDFF
jgi:hypothetical protein